MEKKPKDQPGVKRTKLENAIAVVGFKAALLVGMCCVVEVKLL